MTRSLAASHIELVAAATICAAETNPWLNWPVLSFVTPVGNSIRPWRTSSFWAAEADWTRNLVATAIDLAASRICSSKLRFSFAFYGILPLLHTALVINFNLFIHTWNCSFQLWKYYATKKVMYLTFQVIFNKNFSQKSVEIKPRLRITYHLTFLCAHYTNDYEN